MVTGVYNPDNSPEQLALSEVEVSKDVYCQFRSSERSRTIEKWED